MNHQISINRNFFLSPFCSLKITQINQLILYQLHCARNLKYATLANRPRNFPTYKLVGHKLQKEKNPLAKVQYENTGSFSIPTVAPDRIVCTRHLSVAFDVILHKKKLVCKHFRVFGSLLILFVFPNDYSYLSQME